MEDALIQHAAGDTERTVWHPRETDHGLEAEMLRRLMLYLGIAEQQANRAVRRARAKGLKSAPA